MRTNVDLAPPGLIVTGTDTDVGKTVVSALLMLGLDADYWKPIQSGLDLADTGATDRERIQNLTELPTEYFIPEAYVFEHPLSPHAAAELEGVEIDRSRLDQVPYRGIHRPVIVEGAGGLLVPVNQTTYMVDLFKHWRLPVVLCARTKLGTINHTLLSIEALRNRDMSILGVVFVGEENPNTESTICDLGNVKRLGRVPILRSLNRQSLLGVFDQEFRLEDFSGFAPRSRFEKGAEFTSLGTSSGEVQL